MLFVSWGGGGETKILKHFLSHINHIKAGIVNECKQKKICMIKFIILRSVKCKKTLNI